MDSLVSLVIKESLLIFSLFLLLFFSKLFFSNSFQFKTLIDIEFGFINKVSSPSPFWLSVSKLFLNTLPTRFFWKILISSLIFLVNNSFLFLLFLLILSFFIPNFFLFSFSSFFISLIALIIFCFFLIFLYKYLFSFKTK